LVALGGAISVIGFILILHRNELPGALLQYAGEIVAFVGTAIFVYGLIDQWRIATRRKSPGDLPNSEVWFCPYCGNLDVKGGEHCPGCGKLLPRRIAIKNGVWVSADLENPHKITIGKRGKGV
jgi:hypothetical protein